MGNMAEHLGGAIDAIIYFDGRVTFFNNLADTGEALRIEGKLYFYANTVIYFENNGALTKGGAIYFEDTDPIAYCGCLKFHFNFLNTFFKY